MSEIRRLIVAAVASAGMNETPEQVADRILSGAAFNDDADRYVIWSNEHRQWWRAGRMGYAVDFHDAGIYSRREALEICSQAIPGWLAHRRPPGFHEVPIRLADLKRMVAESPAPGVLS